MQTHLGSIVETVVSTAVGFVISLGLNLIIFPAVGCQISHAQNATIILIFTAASLIRSYFLRRLFNKIAIRYKF